MNGPITYRRAGEDDAEAIARLFRRVRQTSLPYLPDLHSPEEDLAHFGGTVLPSSSVWLAEADGLAAGFVASTPGWIDHLYVAPERHGEGIGTRLLVLAMEGQAAIDLWVFTRNTVARRFYERHGFQLVETTDGADNEEREPDARYRWRRPD